MNCAVSVPSVSGRQPLRSSTARGCAALSARRLAATLGCEAMSLYHHVESMEAVLDLVVDEALAQIQAPFSTSRADLLQQSRHYLEFAEAHPHVFAVVATRRWQTPRALALAEACHPAPVRRWDSRGVLHSGGRAFWAPISTAQASRSRPGISRRATRGQAATVREDLLAGLEELIAAVDPEPQA